MARQPTGGPHGRPPYKPTDQDRAIVKNLVAAGTPEERICQCLDMSQGIDQETMRKHFARELKTAREEVTAMAMRGVATGIAAGNLDACYKWLRCRAGWKESSQVEHTGKDGGIIEMNVNHRAVIEDRLARIRDRIGTSGNPGPALGS